MPRVLTSATHSNRDDGGKDQARQRNARQPAAAGRTTAAKLHDLVVLAVARSILVLARAISKRGGHGSS
jgi:hypothetical protein